MNGLIARICSLPYIQIEVFLYELFLCSGEAGAKTVRGLRTVRTDGVRSEACWRPNLAIVGFPSFAQHTLPSLFQPRGPDLRNHGIPCCTS
jgi:hypothetical protein